MGGRLELEGTVCAVLMETKLLLLRKNQNRIFSLIRQLINNAGGEQP